MKIRIDEVGYENYTGQLGLVEFVDGVSVNDVSAGEINRMAAVIRVVDVESDAQIGSLVDLEKNMDYNFPVEVPLPTGTDAAFVGDGDEIPAEILDENGNPTVQVTPAILGVSVAPISDKFTLEQLETLADKEGIAGIRAVAELFGVKGTSIVGLIQEVLDAQALKA